MACYLKLIVFVCADHPTVIAAGQPGGCRVVGWHISLNWCICVQITQRSVRLVSLAGAGLLCEWTHPEGRNISLASCNTTQAVIAAGSELHYFELAPGQIKHAGWGLEPGCATGRFCQDQRCTVDLTATPIPPNLSMTSYNCSCSCCCAVSTSKLCLQLGIKYKKILLRILV